MASELPRACRSRTVGGESSAYRSSSNDSEIEGSSPSPVGRGSTLVASRRRSLSGEIGRIATRGDAAARPFFLPDPLEMPDPERRDTASDSGAGAAPDTPPSPEKRRFLSQLAVGLGAVAGLLAGLPVIGVLFSPVIRRDPEAWRAVGTLSDFPIGETLMVRYIDPDPLPWAGLAGLSSAWLRRDSNEEIVAFSMYCTHTGCPVTWSPGADMFMCPCHGGTFYRDGTVAAGPPPRPLERLPVRIRSGQVEIRTVGAPLTD